MTTPTTGPNLPVIGFRNILVLGVLAEIRLSFGTPPVGPLYIGTINLYPRASVSTFDGRITQGNPNSGSLSTVYVNPVIFAAIETFLATQVGVEAAVVYDDVTRIVSDVIFISESVNTTVRSAVVALDAHVGPGNVNAELQAIRHTLTEVVEALQSFAPPDSRSRGLSDEVQTEDRPSMAVPRSPKQQANK
jgi:hypothetical protein